MTLTQDQAVSNSYTAHEARVSTGAAAEIHSNWPEQVLFDGALGDAVHSSVKLFLLALNQQNPDSSEPVMLNPPNQVSSPVVSETPDLSQAAIPEGIILRMNAGSDVQSPSQPAILGLAA